jgi:phosphotransferase system  glucose/maltose/N-acetylglucosamine-specific IIC component
MVDLSGSTSGGLIEHGFNNYVFLVSGVLVATVVGFFAYKLVKSLQEKERKREEKKKLKEQKKKK